MRVLRCVRVCFVGVVWVGGRGVCVLGVAVAGEREWGRVWWPCCLCVSLNR